MRPLHGKQIVRQEGDCGQWPQVCLPFLAEATQRRMTTSGGRPLSNVMAHSKMVAGRVRAAYSFGDEGTGFADRTRTRAATQKRAGVRTVTEEPAPARDQPLTNYTAVGI